MGLYNQYGISSVGAYDEFQYRDDCFVVASSNSPSWVLDSTYNALFANFDSMPLPGGVVGPDGWYDVYIEWSASNTNTGNAKTLQVVYDHLNAVWTDVITGSNQSSVLQFRISNRGNQQVNIGSGNQNLGVHANVIQSLAMDLSQDHTLTLFGSIIGSGDTLKIERWSVTAYNPPRYPRQRNQYGAVQFYGANAHFDDTQSIAFHIAGLKTMGMKLMRMTWEGGTSLTTLEAYATALQTDNTGIKMYCCLDLSVYSSGTTYYTSEAAAYSATFSAVQAVVQALAPLGVTLFECGNEMDTKASINTGDPQGGLPTDFSNTIVPLFRGVQRGAIDAVHSVAGCLAGSNAYTVCSIGLSDMMFLGTQPDGTSGHPVVRPDFMAWHNYEDYGPLMGVEMGNSRPWVNIYEYLSRKYGVPIFISEWNAKQSDTDAQRAVWAKRHMYDAYNNRYKYNIAAIIVYEMYGSPWAVLDGSANTPISTFGTVVQSFISSNPDTGL